MSQLQTLLKSASRRLISSNLFFPPTVCLLYIEQDMYVHPLWGIIEQQNKSFIVYFQT